MRLKKNRKFLKFFRILTLGVLGGLVAVFIAISQIDMDVLKKDLVSILQTSTGLPIAVDGAVSWKVSLKPKVELNQVRIENAEWAAQKDGFVAEKIEVSLNLFSLFGNSPTIESLKIYNAKMFVEKNDAGQYSIQSSKPETTEDSSEDEKTNEPIVKKYPFNLNFGLGAIEVSGIDVKLGQSNYSLNGFKVEYKNLENRIEYSGWIRSGFRIYPFVISFDELNTARKVYPIKFAMSSGGDALVADIALEQTSKMPIDFIIRGDLPDIDRLGEIVGMDLPGMSTVSVDIAGGLEYETLTFRRANIKIKNSNIDISGKYNWGGDKPYMDIKIKSDNLNIVEMFPKNRTSLSEQFVKLDRPLNVFRDTPLYGYLLNEYDFDLTADIKNLTVYRDLNITDIDVDIKLKDSKMDVVTNSNIADGNVRASVEVLSDVSGRLYATAAGLGDKISFGEVLNEVHQYGYLSDLPIDFKFYLMANGSDLTELMSTITGPIDVYSSARGYIHSDLVSYVYGADFLTTLRHDIEDLFKSEKEHDQITVYCATARLKLRNGVVHTENEVAMETNTVNIKLKGDVDLGGETLNVSMATFPVRGIKLSLSGNVVNMMEVKGSMAQPTISVSGSEIASKVASATGLGLLLAPFTGGIGLVAGAGVGYFAGDLLENWLADDNPCKTASQEGSPAKQGDPEWLNSSIDALINSMIK